MKTLLLAVSSILALQFSAPAADIKIGVIDMARAFAEYHKTKTAEDKIEESKASSKRELDASGERHKVLVGKYEKLVTEIRDPGISEQLRKSKEEEAKKVAAEARSLERERADFASRRERQLMEEANRTRKALMEEINKVVSDHARLQNFDLVFDKSGLSTRGVPFLLYSKSAIDFSEAVIQKLNEGV